MSLYSDHRTWQKLDCSPDIYSWSITDENFFDLRMLALRLEDQSLAVYSPVGSADDAAITQLRQLGNISALIASNHFHNLGLQPFLQHFPKAGVYATATATPRLGKVTGLPVRDIGELTARLPDGLELFAPAGLKTGELWILVRNARPGPILVVSDSFFNMPPKPGLFGLILKVAGTVPGLRISRVFRLMALAQRDEYRASMERCLNELRPQVLVPSHGAIFTHPQLTQELLALL
jgi:glyoxylase-like metal-dependent hydrolase (beta-lactamase superfamily II)